MLNPLAEFKKTLIKDVILLGKTFTFNIAVSVKSSDKINILINSLVAIDNIKLSEFDNVKIDLARGLTYEEAVRKELETWEPEIINILINKFIKLFQDQKQINFKDYPDLRIYWKLRKIFSKEEIDNWTQLDYDWAIWNLHQDLIEKDEFDDRNLEKRKIWMNTELYKNLRKQKETKQQQKFEEEQLLKKIIEDEKLNKFNIEFDLVDAEEEDIPTMIGK